MSLGRMVGLGMVVALAAACSSSSSRSGSTQGTGNGTDGGSGSGGTSDSGGSSSGGTLPDGATASSDGATGASGDAGSLTSTAICQGLFLYEQQCGEDQYSKSQACLTGREANCSATLAIYTPTFQQAIGACNTTATSCDDGPGNCYDQQLLNVQPTAAQIKVRTDFCAGCPAMADCAATFLAIDPNNGDGPGAQTLQVSDAVAAQLDAQCTGTALLDAGAGSDCTQAFPTCAADVISSALPDDPDACYPPGDDDDDSGSGDSGVDAGDGGG